MFRKRKDSEGAQGLNRIARLIEQRQREAAGEPGDEALLSDDDTIVLNRGGAPREAAEDESGSDVSLVAPRERYENETDVSPVAPPNVPAYGQAQEAAAAESAPAPSAFAQHTYSTPAWQTSAEPQRSYGMPVPNIGASAAGGTLVAADAEWEGKLIARGDVRVEGVLRGEIEAEGTLIIAPNAQVHGIVRARDIVLGGDMEGEISCEHRLEILPGGSARGQINSGTLVVHEGAYIDSRFQMRRGDAENGTAN